MLKYKVFLLYFCVLVGNQILAETLKLKNTNSNNYLISYSLPSTAPTDFETLEALNLPNPEDYQLRIPMVPGSYFGPDGGSVTVSGRDSYEWGLKSGRVFTRWNDKQWQLKIGSHIVSSPNGHAYWNSLIRIQFPDGTIISKHKIPKTNIHQYTYDKKGNVSNNLHFDIVHPTYWGDKRIQIGVYDITYSAKWDLMIEGLKEWKGLPLFLSYMDDNFGYSSNKIKVILHSSPKNFWTYLNRDPNTKDGCSGESNKTVFSLCPSKGIGLFSSGDSNIDAVLKLNFDYRSFLHDSIHYIQANRCEIISESPKPSLSEPWFLEGIAEMGIIRNSPRYRQETYKRFYKTFFNTKPSFEKGNDPSFDDYRLIGTMFLEFISIEKGNKKIKKFYDKTCEGINPEVTFEEEFGKSIKVMYSEMYTYFKNNRSQIEDSMRKWELEGLPKVSFLKDSNSLCSRVNEAILKPIDLINKYDDIPCFLGSYEYDLKSYMGKIEGNFSGEYKDGSIENVFLWLNGSYSVTGNNFKAIVGEDESQLEYKDLKFINWKSKPDRQIVYPNGKRIHCWNEKSGCSKPY